VLRKRHRVSGTAAHRPAPLRSPSLTRLGLPVRGLRKCAAGWKTRAPEASPRKRYGCAPPGSASVPIAHAIGAFGEGSTEVRRGLETRAPEASPRKRYGCAPPGFASVPIAHAIGAFGAGSGGVRRGLETRATLRPRVGNPRSSRARVENPRSSQARAAPSLANARGSRGTRITSNRGPRRATGRRASASRC